MVASLPCGLRVRRKHRVNEHAVNRNTVSCQQNNAMAKTNAKNNTTVNATKRSSTVNVVLMSYKHSEFNSFVKEQQGALLLDARISGGSAERKYESAMFKRKYGTRYALVPGLGFKSDMKPAEWVEYIQPAVSKIVNALDMDQPIIITGWHTSHLRALGHIIAKASAKANVQIRYDFGEDAEKRYANYPVGFIDAKELTTIIDKFLKNRGMDATSNEAANASEFGF